MKIHIQATKISAIALVAALAPAHAFGQQAAPASAAPAQSDAELQDIVVTARKRTERLIDVPVAATVLSKESLSRYNSTSLTSISQQVPSLIIAESGVQTGGSTTLRGVGASNFNPTSDQLVSVNVDGVQVSQGNILRLGQYDLERLEVLKGPQTLFFGKNSPGGVISLTTADGGNKFEAQVRSGYEFEAKRRFVEGFVGGPLGGGFTARIFGNVAKEDGYFRNEANPVSGLRSNQNTGSVISSSFVRGTLKYESPSSAFSARLKVSHSYLNNSSGADAISQLYFCALAVPQIGGAPAPFGTPANCKLDRNFVGTKVGPALTAIDPLNYGDGQPYIRSSQTLASLELNYNIGTTATLTSVTGYYQSREDLIGTFLRTEAALLAARSNLRNRQFTQEVRLASTLEGPLNFLVGGFYQKSKIQDLIPVTFGVPVFPGAPVPFEAPIDDIGTKTDAYSFFGQARYKILDNLELAAGARYSHEHKSIIGTVGGGSFKIPVQQVPNLVNPNNTNFHDFSPDVTLTYKPSKSLTLYAAYREGFVSGGYNTAASQFLGTLLSNFFSGGAAPLKIQDLRYQQTTVRGGEGGIKGYLFENQLRFDLSAYYYTFKGLQLPQQDPTGIGLTVKNAASSKVRGVELNTFFRPRGLPGLEARLGISYNKANYDKFIGGCYVGQTIAQGCNLIPAGGVAGAAFTSQDQSGQPLLRAPKWTVDPGFTYDHDLGSGLAGSLSFDAGYQSSYNSQLENDPASRQNGYWLLNGSIAIRGHDNGWELALIGRNLTNKLAITASTNPAFQGGGTGTAVGTRADIAGVVVPPRSVMLQITLKSSLLTGQ